VLLFLFLDFYLQDNDYYQRTHDSWSSTIRGTIDGTEREIRSGPGNAARHGFHSEASCVHSWRGSSLPQDLVISVDTAVITSLRAKDDYALPPVPRPSFALDGRFFIESILSAGEGVYPDLPEETRLARKAESIHSRKKS